MARFNGAALTVTVTGCSSGATADGRYSILLQTLELQTIAFEVDPKAIASLERQIAAIRTMMQAPKGTA